jgi:hypothetical protein
MPFPTYAVSTELDAVNQILKLSGTGSCHHVGSKEPRSGHCSQHSYVRSIDRYNQKDGPSTLNVDYEMTPDSVPPMRSQYPYNVLQMDANVEHHKNDYDISTS